MSYPGYPGCLPLASGALVKITGCPKFLFMRLTPSTLFMYGVFSNCPVWRTWVLSKISWKYKGACLYGNFLRLPLLTAPTWVVYVCFPLDCFPCILFTVAVAKLFYWCTRVPVCLLPLASVLPLDLGRWICCSGLLKQRFDCSHLLAVSLPTEFAAPVLRPMSKFQNTKCPPNRNRVYLIWIGIFVLCIFKRQTVPKIVIKGSCCCELYIRLRWSLNLSQAF